MNPDVKKRIRKMNMSIIGFDEDRWSSIHLRYGKSPVTLCLKEINNIRAIESYSLQYFYGEISCKICLDKLFEMEENEDDTRGI